MCGSESFRGFKSSSIWAIGLHFFLLTLKSLYIYINKGFCILGFLQRSQLFRWIGSFILVLDISQSCSYFATNPINRRQYFVFEASLHFTKAIFDFFCCDRNDRNSYHRRFYVRNHLTEFCSSLFYPMRCCELFDVKMYFWLR